MQELLHQLASGEALTAEQAQQAFETVMRGEASEAQTAALLSLIAGRGATVPELVGAARAMREHAVRVEVPGELTVIDTCGTGGDHAGTFNVSTAAAIVTAAAGREHGVAVAKHGNRSVSSTSGSSQVLETLGVKLPVSGQTLSQCLREAGICFCYAPAHHPAMEHAAPVRKALGFRTIFNLLGPLTNPAGASRQLIGVYSSAMTQPLAEALHQLGAERVMVVHGQIPDPDGVHIDGLDELSTCGPSQVAEVDGQRVRSYELDPQQYELAYSHPSALRAEGPEQSAALVQGVLDGAHGPAREIVAFNAAAALMIAGVAADLEEGLERAFAAIDRGAAKQVLQDLVRVTTADPTPTG
jgi:anthranilate phosphoribosyltransferase